MLACTEFHTATKGLSIAADVFGCIIQQLVVLSVEAQGGSHILGNTPCLTFVVSPSTLTSHGYPAGNESMGHGCRWSAQILDIRMPEALADLTELFLDRAHAECSPDSQLVFSRPNGTALEKSQQLATLWKHILKKELGSDSKITPHM